MTEFKRGLTTGMNDVKDSEAIGVADDKYGMGDIGKLVKMAGASFIPCEDGDLIEGQIESFREFTVNDGVPFGTVKKGPRLAVVVKTANAAEYGKLVVAEAQAALAGGSGVADPSINGVVKVAADQAATKSTWRIYEILGDKAAANCKVIIERI